MKEFRDQLDNLIDKVFIRPSIFMGCSIIVVKKKNCSLKVSIDDRKLNNAKIKNKYPIPMIDDLFM